MARLDNGIDLSVGRSDRSTFWIVFGLLIAGFFIGQFVSSMLVIIFVFMGGGGLDSMTDVNQIFEYLSKPQFMISQAFYTLTFTFLTPWFYLKMFAKKSFKDLSPDRKTTLVSIVLTLLGTFAFMMFNSLLIEWNAGMSLPEFMSGLENWMRETEEQLAETTAKLTEFDNFGQFLIAFMVIAVLPGIGEEYLFRGVLQNALHRWSKNAHLAIWISAFLFGAIHLQFYGLLPRMALGALFGYLYLWSGNLRYAVIAHIANNGIALLMAYLYQIGTIDIDFENTESTPVVGSIIGLIAMIGIFFLFRNHHIKSKSAL